MPEEVVTEAEEVQPEQSQEAEPEATEAEGEKALGDAGKKALDAMKAKWKAAEDRAKSEAAEKAALIAKLEGKEAEHAAEQDKQRIKDEALAAANQRILKAEIRAAAAGKLNNPDDALRYPEVIDLSSLEVGEDGEVDSSAIAAAVADLIAKYPYLAAQGGSKFQGSADGGARNGSAKSIDAQIAEAEKAGDFKTSIALKQQRAAQSNKP